MESVHRTYEEQVTGVNLIAGEERASGAEWLATSPVTGEEFPVVFHDATQDDVLMAVSAAAEAFRSRWHPDREALITLLRGAADELEQQTGVLLELVNAETGLKTARVQRELSRTTEQLRFFAGEVEDGTYVAATITREDPDAPGGARVDARRMLLPLGPVAVFGASNFPLAYSVPGGDTASALAAGCPAIVKAHPAHPGTSEVCARAIRRGVERAGLPPSWFSMVQGRGNDVGTWLVTAPELTAAGFTGSLRGGRALYDLGASRERPIPVFAEMGSMNPVYVTPAAVRARARDIGAAFVGSITTDAGQFCTKPGVAFVPDMRESKEFVEAVAEGIASSDPGVLVSDRIHQQLRRQISAFEDMPGVTVVATGSQPEGALGVPATVVQCSLETYLQTPELAEEHFGPLSVLVSYEEDDSLVDVARRFEGTLSSTVHAEDDDVPALQELIGELAQRSGRLVWNSMPTGLAVAHATNHGGPYPATTAPLFTSVGATSIRRWLRPISYQTAPQHLLPPALQDDNPLGLLRNIDGEWTRGAVGDDG